MGEATAISWCDATFSPWWGCDRVSPGCARCYAADLAARHRPNVKLWDRDSVRQVAADSTWLQPLAWNRKAERRDERLRVFPSMCDPFEDRLDLDQPRARFWDLIRATPALEWLLLTKRPENIRHMLPMDWSSREGWPHVWLGVSIESAAYEERIRWLVNIPAAVRFVSYEPALGPLSRDLDLRGVAQLIYGGESGKERRPDHDEWPEQARTLCREQGVAFWFKQRSSLRPGAGAMPDGSKPQEMPWRAPRVDGAPGASVAAESQPTLFGGG